MNELDLRRALVLGKSARIEWRPSLTPEAAGAVICALLNASGGYLIGGVDDRHELVGVPAGGEIGVLQQAVFERLAPTALVSFDEQVVEGARLWRIEVPAGRDTPYSFGDEILVFDRKGVRRADVAMIRDMVLSRQVEPERWERQYSEANVPQDLDMEELRSAIAGFQTSRRATVAFGDPGDVGRVLGQLGLFRYGRLTNGGDVLFGANPALRHPQVRVRAVAYRSSKADPTYRDFRNFEGPLVRVLEQVAQFIESNTPRTARFDPAQLVRRDQGLYPASAVREGLVNAFAHRDYADFRGGIQVNVHLDRLEIWNSGSLPEGVTPEVIGSGQLSVLRNPDIAHVLYMRGYMERLGRGGLMIRTACAEHRLPPPRWEAEPGRGVRLTFFAPEATPEVTPQVTPEVAPEVTPEVAAVLDALCADEALSRRDLQDAMALRDAEHFRVHYLVPALKAGMIEMTIPDKPRSRLQRYRITDRGRAALAASRGERG